MAKKRADEEAEAASKAAAAAEAAVEAAEEEEKTKVDDVDKETEDGDGEESLGVDNGDGDGFGEAGDEGEVEDGDESVQSGAVVQEAHFDVESRRLLASLDMSVSLIARGGSGGGSATVGGDEGDAAVVVGEKVKGRKKKAKAALTSLAVLREDLHKLFEHERSLRMAKLNQNTRFPNLSMSTPSTYTRNHIASEFCPSSCGDKQN